MLVSVGGGDNRLRLGVVRVQIRGCFMVFNQHDQKARDIKWDFGLLLEKLEIDHKISFKHTWTVLTERFLNEVVGYERIEE